jgi:hypothetical protein
MKILDMDFAEVLPSPVSWFTVGIMAITFIVFAKWVVNQWSNPVTDAVKTVVNAV